MRLGDQRGQCRAAEVQPHATGVRRGGRTHLFARPQYAQEGSFFTEFLGELGVSHTKVGRILARLDEPCKA